MSSRRVDLPENLRPNTEEAAAVFKFIDDSGPHRIPREVIVLEASSTSVYTLMQNKTALLLKDNGYPVDYISTERATDFNWGASGLEFSWLVELGRGLVAQELIRRIKQVLGTQPPIEPLSLQEGVQLAKQSVARAYTISANELTYTGETTSPGEGVTVVLLEHADASFEVTIGRSGSIYLSAHITRRDSKQSSK